LKIFKKWDKNIAPNIALRVRCFLIHECNKNPRGLGQYGSKGKPKVSVNDKKKNLARTPGTISEFV